MAGFKRLFFIKIPKLKSTGHIHIRSGLLVFGTLLIFLSFSLTSEGTSSSSSSSNSKSTVLYSSSSPPFLPKSVSELSSQLMKKLRNFPAEIEAQKNRYEVESPRTIGTIFNIIWGFWHSFWLIIYLIWLIVKEIYYTLVFKFTFGDYGWS